MLDQNTDRMWYVIGAVIVGAAIILILNGTMPEIFASVADTFKGKTDDVTTVVDGISPTGASAVPGGNGMTDGVMPVPIGENLLDASMLTIAHTPTYDTSRYDSEGIVDMFIPDIDTSKWAGLSIYAKNLPIEANTTYELSFSYQKIDGELLVMAGHTEPLFSDNVFYVDGVESPREWMTVTGSPHFETTNDTDVHDVQVYFTIGDDISSVESSRFWIQPNRGIFEDVSVRLTDLTFKKVK